MLLLYLDMSNITQSLVQTVKQMLTVCRAEELQRSTETDPSRQPPQQTA